MFQTIETTPETINWAAIKNPALLKPISMSHCHDENR